MPHEASNLSETGTGRAFVSRNEPAEQDRITPRPPASDT
jgi:hypothetical protein